MIVFKHAARAIRLLRCQARIVTSLIVVGWLAFAQPGMELLLVIDPGVHARIDAERYGQQPDGENTSGPRASTAHEHSIILGITVSAMTLVNPFGAAFYRVLSPAQRRALLDRRVELAVIAQSITLEPPDQPTSCGIAASTPVSYFRACVRLNSYHKVVDDDPKRRFDAASFTVKLACWTSWNCAGADRRRDHLAGLSPSKSATDHNVGAHLVTLAPA
jgi:hypothetical protein